MPRVVRCKIEMDLVEGEHFNPDNRRTLDDNQAQEEAIRSFLDMFQSDIEDYVQTKVVEPIGDN